MPIKFNITRRRGRAKIKIEDKRKEVMNKIVDSYSEDFDVKMSLIQELIPLGLKAVTEELQAEVKRLAGERHERGGDNARWGKQNGSVYLRDQKFQSRCLACAIRRPTKKFSWNHINAYNSPLPVTNKQS